MRWESNNFLESGACSSLPSFKGWPGLVPTAHVDDFSIDPSELACYIFRDGDWWIFHCAQLSRPPTHWHTKTCHEPGARAFQSSLVKGVAKAALYCAHQTIYMFSPSLLVLSQRWG